MFPSCSLITRDAISCCPAQDESDGAYYAENASRILGGGDGVNVCTSSLVETKNQAGCDEYKYHGVHVAHDVLFWTTIGILGTFELELVLLIYLLGPKKFCHQVIYIVDLVIVTTSLVLELLFRMLYSEIGEAAGILVIFRVWRFVRIGHGLVASTYEIEEHKIHDAMEHIEELEKRLERWEDDVPERPPKLRRSEN